MEFSLTKTKELTFNDLDMNLTWRISYMLNELAMIATEHALEIGAWKEEFNGIYGWVVSKQRVKYYQPITKQTVTIKTWIGKSSSVIFPRYYTVHGEKGELLVEVCAIWTLLDLKKRRIVPPTRVGLSYPNVEEEDKIKKPDSIDYDVELDYLLTRKVLFSDIDVHQHMNNARYMEWACDFISLDEINPQQMDEFTIYYKKEIQPLSDVKVYLGKQDSRYIIKGNDSKDENTHFEIECLFKSSNQ